ncbi:unnamed protein product [Rotaria magnacalcarata]|uniref:TNF receptor-associated factor 6 n=1 Tax=Rotaria magnacalcarata TaxID=392030 RepID=A0A816WNU6_9BILA|nr:unnamed protein product [Rotaria magnacalcarata]
MTSNNFYEYIDRASIDENLICEVCHNPFLDPVVTQCGYTYCGPCIEQNIKSGSHCPSQSCNQLLSADHLTPNPTPRLIISMLDNLRVRCRLCGETNVNRRNFDEHLQGSCPERRIDCSAKDVGCPWSGPKNEHNEHVKMCIFEKLRPVVDILYKVIENQRLDIEKLQKQTEQQTTEIGQLNTQLDQQKAQLQGHEIKIGDIQSQNQSQNNEIASIREQITTLEGKINKVRSAIHWLSK